MFQFTYYFKLTRARLAIAVAVLLAFVLVLCSATWSPHVPRCDDPAVAHNYSEMFKEFLASAIDERKLDVAMPPVRVDTLREVGHASALRTRGCTAAVDIDGERGEYAFVVAPADDDPDSFQVAGMNDAIVRARFGNIDAEGGYGNTAAPVGREEVARALRAAVDARHAQPDDTDRMQARLPWQMQQGDTSRFFELDEMEPLGPCRALRAGTRYRCRLLVQGKYTVDMPSRLPVFDGEFTFERDGPGQPWRMAASFGAEMDRASKPGAGVANAPVPLSETPADVVK